REKRLSTTRASAKRLTPRCTRPSARGATASAPAPWSHLRRRSPSPPRPAGAAHAPGTSRGGGYRSGMSARSSASVKRLTLAATILGSGIVLLDGTVVNVALPTIQRGLGGGLAAQQWIVNGYLLTLSSLILVGGSLGDLYGERRVFAIGVA